MMLDDDHVAVQDAVRGYVQDRIAPNAARWDREATSRRPSCRAWPRSAATASPCRPSYDGAGLDYLALAVILEEIAAGDGATSTDRQRQQLPGLLDPDGVGERRAEGAVAEAARARRRCSARSA